ncbi:MAG: hypothetical protein MUO39_12085 [Steroidobacteraceae bacterium]|nr:hypothetical protein [Steroidobacteraceae bacterium]
MLRYLLAWFPMLVLAIANGALRQATYARRMPELGAHQLSTVIGAAIFGVYIWFVIRTWPPVSTQQALQVGLLWLALTIAFEFFMGLVLARRPLNEVLRDYDVTRGRVWVFLLLWIALAPALFQLFDRN